jgi:hypothetical protein
VKRLREALETPVGFPEIKTVEDRGKNHKDVLLMGVKFF